MEKGVLLIACFFIFSAHAVEKESETQKVKDDPEMEVLVEHISNLASKVLEIFEPIAAKATNETFDDNENTYFVSFLLRDRKNKTKRHEDGQPRQRMVVNNNFNGDRMGTSQVFVENGPPPKQPPMHNIQVLNNAGSNPSQGYLQPNPYHKIYPQQPHQQIAMNYG